MSTLFVAILIICHSSSIDDCRPFNFTKPYVTKDACVADLAVGIKAGMDAGNLTLGYCAEIQVAPEKGA